MSTQETYETVECSHKKVVRDANGTLCPRHCGDGRTVHKPVPYRYRRTWPSIPTVVPVIPHPEPIVRARPATADEIPPSARSMVKLAELAGFDVAVTYAKGSPAHGVTGKPLAPRASILVRMQHPANGTRLAAQWLDGKADDNNRKVRHSDGRVTDLSDSELRAMLSSATPGRRSSDLG
jgi:hypothetical protein